MGREEKLRKIMRFNSLFLCFSMFLLLLKVVSCHLCSRRFLLHIPLVCLPLNYIHSYNIEDLLKTF